MGKVCRLCGNTSKESMYNVFCKNESDQQIIQLIKQCLPILIYRNDPLPKEICKKCYVKLNEYSLFQKNTIKVHDIFKINLGDRIQESPVKLYLDTLENAYQPETLQINNIRSPRPVRNFAAQFQVETKTSFTSTSPPEQDFPKIGCIRSLKILTPNLINEKSSESNMYITLQDRDGAIHKKRKIAGPKSKTRFFYPPSLMQCALKQINKNLNLIDDYSVSDYTSETADTAETSEYSVSRSASQERDLFTPDFNTDSLDFDINLNEPVLCNYCLKRFNNIVELSNHEIEHIKVDVGPKIDSNEFGEKCEKYYELYKDFLVRQTMTESEPQAAELVEEVRVKPELRPKREIRNCRNPCSRSQPPVEEENSLLVPSDKTITFTITNFEVFVNGVALKTMKKEDRRRCYKDIVINDIKRKYCTLCCHTFKDNWAIEAHYMSDSCQYTCKYCGLKFKNQKLLFETHLKIHKNESANKVFGPMNKKMRLKKKYRKTNRQIFVGQMMANVPPKVKPIKLKQLLQKKGEKIPGMQIKQEPGLGESNHAPSSSNIRGRHEPYQAYFCRKCFKVFFDVNEYNKHIRVCNGASKKGSKTSETTVTATKVETVATTSSKTETPPSLEHHSSSGRPVRSCVKDISSLTNDSASDSDDVAAPKKSKKENEVYECSICCTTFPSRYSRNSHMRIHKGQTPTQISQIQLQPQLQHQHTVKTYAAKFPSPKPQTVTKQEFIQPKLEIRTSPDIHFANLNPAVARLVQNNPHLTIRSYSKSETDRFQQDHQQPNMQSAKIIDIQPQAESTPEHNIKRVYKCADCEDKFENKSVLYYHKMNSCIVKRHYECAFCRKKFGTYDQYNTHMFYVHPE